MHDTHIDVGAAVPAKHVVAHHTAHLRAPILGAIYPHFTVRALPEALTLR